MASKIQIKRTKTPGNKPTTTQLQEGELALNLPDKKIFTNDGTNIIELGKVDYASDAEVAAGTVTDKVISPKGLQSRIINTDVHKTVGTTVGNDFVNLDDAIQWVQRSIFAPGGHLYLQLDNEDHVINVNSSDPDYFGDSLAGFSNVTISIVAKSFTGTAVPTIKVNPSIGRIRNGFLFFNSWYEINRVILDFSDYKPNSDGIWGIRAANSTCGGLNLGLKSVGIGMGMEGGSFPNFEGFPLGLEDIKDTALRLENVDTTYGPYSKTPIKGTVGSFIQLAKGATLYISKGNTLDKGSASCFTIDPGATFYALVAKCNLTGRTFPKNTGDELFRTGVPFYKVDNGFIHDFNFGGYKFEPIYTPTATPANDAKALVALNATGKIDSGFLPPSAISYASDDEVHTGTVTDKVISPKGLRSLIIDGTISKTVACENTNTAGKDFANFQDALDWLKYRTNFGRAEVVLTLDDGIHKITKLSFGPFYEDTKNNAGFSLDGNINLTIQPANWSSKAHPENFCTITWGAPLATADIKSAIMFSLSYGTLKVWDVNLDPAAGGIAAPTQGYGSIFQGVKCYLELDTCVLKNSGSEPAIDARYQSNIQATDCSFVDCNPSAIVAESSWLCVKGSHIDGGGKKGAIDVSGCQVLGLDTCVLGGTTAVVKEIALGSFGQAPTIFAAKTEVLEQMIAGNIFLNGYNRVKTHWKTLTAPTGTPADDATYLVRLNATGKIDSGFLSIPAGLTFKSSIDITAAYAAPTPAWNTGDFGVVKTTGNVGASWPGLTAGDAAKQGDLIIFDGTKYHLMPQESDLSGFVSKAGASAMANDAVLTWTAPSTLTTVLDGGDSNKSQIDNFEINGGSY